MLPTASARRANATRVAAFDATTVSPFGDNETDVDEACVERSVQEWSLSIVSLLLSVLILAGSSFIVVAVLRQWAREGRPLGNRAASCFLVLNLATADALVGVFQIVVWIQYEVCGVYVSMAWSLFSCKLPSLLSQFADSASAITIVVIAIDRAVSVAHAVRYRNLLSPRCALGVISAVWIVALLLSLTVFMIPGAYVWNGICENDAVYDTAVFWSTVSIMFTTLLGCYLRIHQVTLGMMRRGSTQTPRRAMGTKAARTLLFILAWDGCAYLPVLVVTLVELAGVNVNPTFYRAVRMLTLLTFLADPYIYAYSNPRTKKAIKDLARSCRGKTHEDLRGAGNRDSFLGEHVSPFQRIVSTLTASSITCDGEKPDVSPSTRRNSLGLS